MLSATMARTKVNLETAGVSASTFAQLAGVPLSSLTAALRGSHYFGGPEEARLLTVSVRLAALIEAAKPFECPKRNAEVLAALLESTPEKVRDCVGSIFGREGVDCGTF